MHHLTCRLRVLAALLALTACSTKAPVPAKTPADVAPDVPDIAADLASEASDTAAGPEPDATPPIEAAADASTAMDASAPLPVVKIEPDRPVLDWSGDTAIAHNQALAPKGWQEVEQTACAKDPTRQYIGELFKFGIKDIQVNWHWAPVWSGPNAAHPTLDQPEVSVAGELLGASEPGDDVLADHPFGADFNSEVQLDAPYTFASGEHDEDGALGMVHAEVEDRIFNRKALDFVPKAGDRSLLRGAWILDCGHPPYGTEIHPPTFQAFARQLGKLTDSMAFVAPYRSSLLFNADPKLATAFADTQRFDAPETATFENQLIATVVSAAAGDIDFLSAHALMVANRFDALDWLVCAPLPRPTDATLDAQWRFTLRTGVHVTAVPDEASGCVRFVATMTSDYVPLPLPFTDTQWSWEQLSQSAGGQLGQSIDVRKEIIKLMTKLGFSADAPGLQADHPPHVDAYAQLKPRPDAALASPTAVVEHADDQPYPFYARIHVGWKVP